MWIPPKVTAACRASTEIMKLLQLGEPLSTAADGWMDGWAKPDPEADLQSGVQL